MGETIRNMSFYEFLDKFQGISIDGMKVPLKKRLAHFMVSVKGRPRKIFNRLYYVNWFAWMMLTIFSGFLFPESEMFPRGAIDIICDVQWYLIMLYAVFLIPCIFLLQKLSSWKTKKARGLLRDLIYHSDTHAAIDRVENVVYAAPPPTMRNIVGGSLTSQCLQTPINDETSDD